MLLFIFCSFVYTFLFFFYFNNQLIYKGIICILSMKKKFEEDAKLLFELFVKHKKRILLGFFLNALLIGFTYACIGIRLFYPYHFPVAIGVYLLSFIPLIYALFHSRKTFNKFRTFKFAKKYYGKRKFRILYVLMAAFLMMGLFTVLPFNGMPFSKMNTSEIEYYVNNDLERSIVLMDGLEMSAYELMTQLDNGNRDDIKISWDNFVGVVIESEKITDVHMYFNQLSGDMRAKSFMISYSLYLKKYELIHRIISKVDDSQKAILNEKIVFLNDDNGYNIMMSRFYNPKTLLRVNGGMLYYNSLKFDDEYCKALGARIDESYEYLAQRKDVTFGRAYNVVGGFVESKMFEEWFPIQKTVANFFGDTYMSSRDEKFITVEQLGIMEENLLPGDVILQRRNWYLSNMGIPGFWTHAAMYVGTIDEMNEYFKDILPLENCSKIENCINNYDDVADGNSSVLEAIGPGVVFQTLEESAHADYLVVLRPNLNKTEKFAAVVRVFEDRGKPYDYDFDFETRDELVCSELIYDAYRNSIDFSLTVQNGRLMFSPTDIAQKFAQERNTSNESFTFVYFLDGNEGDGRAYVKSEDDFVRTLSRPKFNWEKSEEFQV